MSVPPTGSSSSEASRRKARRLALLLGLVAVGFYVAFILTSVFQSKH
jgi:uncharacterized membrane protein (DUF485 family)